MTAETQATRAAERAARTSYGRLLAYLARAWRDVGAAEDALSEAFASALAVWPAKGVPANPEAWLLVAARRRLLDAAKARKVRQEAVQTLLATTEEIMPERPLIPDKRLELMFVCAHPAIDRAMHTPLMLQTVLGLDAARIASSFLVAPATMGQRLSRAKARIASAGIAFALPEPDDLAQRIDGVREAIFAAYGTGWDGLAAGDSPRAGLATEAIWLARILLEVVPDDAEAQGLLALMLFCEARRAARRVEGRYVPLDRQDPRLWDAAMIREAERVLQRASRFARPGRFQIEAAIQSALVQSLSAGLDLDRPLLELNRALVAFAPTIGNRVGLAAARAKLEGAEAGLAVLDALDATRIATYQPYWAVRAHLLAEARRGDAEIDAAYGLAIGLCDDPAMRDFLHERQAERRAAAP